MGMKNGTVRRICVVASTVIQALTCLMLAGGASPNTIAVILIFKNIFSGIFDGGAGPIVMEMSATYAAAIMGVLNAANNLTLYAISAQVIGPMLDAGGCRNKATTPAEHTGAYWTVDDACMVDASHSLTDQKDDLICVHGDGVGNVTQSCVLTHTVEVQEAMMERPEDCHATWVSLFLNWGVSLTVGIVVFWVGSVNFMGQTEAIDGSNSAVLFLLRSLSRFMPSCFEHSGSIPAASSGASSPVFSLCFAHFCSCYEQRSTRR